MHPGMDCWTWNPCILTVSSAGWEQDQGHKEEMELLSSMFPAQP